MTYGALKTTIEQNHLNQLLDQLPIREYRNGAAFSGNRLPLRLDTEVSIDHGEDVIGMNWAVNRRLTA